MSACTCPPPDRDLCAHCAGWGYEPGSTVGLVERVGAHPEQCTPNARDSLGQLLHIRRAAGGRTSRWQIVATSAPGDRYNEAELAPTTGAEPAAPEAKPAEVGTPEYLEQALLAAVLQVDQGEIAAVDLYSRRQEPPAVGHGATILFHDGSKIFLNRA